MARPAGGRLGSEELYPWDRLEVWDGSVSPTWVRLVTCIKLLVHPFHVLPFFG